MADKYISVTEVRKKLYYIFRAYGVSEIVKQAILNAIKKITSADGAPVKCGKWMKIQNFARCSECRHEVNWGSKDFLSPYCPNCGAKMDGKEGEKNDT